MTKPNAVPMNDLKRLYQRYEVKIAREVRTLRVSPHQHLICTAPTARRDSRELGRSI